MPPLYEAACPSQHTYEYAETIEGRMSVPKCPVCGKKGYKEIRHAPVVRPDLNDWSGENSGKGRFNKQLMTHCKDRHDAIDKAKAKGWNVLDKM